jgi:hypothetical protein
MALGGVTRLAWRTGSVLIALGLAASEAAAGGGATASGLPGERLIPLHPTVAIGLPARGGAFGPDGGLSATLPLAAQTPRALRPSPWPKRPGELGPPPGERLGGAPLYGLLAGQALLSALHLRGNLPDQVAPWFDGDADHLIAGIELSF